MRNGLSVSAGMMLFGNQSDAAPVGPAAVRGLDPRTIAANPLVRDLDAANMPSITNGGTVADNVSGRSWTVEHLGAASYGAAAFEGEPCLTVPGSDYTSLVANASGDLDALVAGVNGYSVLLFDAPTQGLGGYYTVLQSDGASGGDGGAQSWLMNHNNQFLRYASGPAANIDAITGVTNAVSGKPAVTAYTYDGAGTEKTYFLGQDPATAGNALSFTAGAVWRALSDAGHSFTYAGRFRRLMIFQGALSQAQIQGIQLYLTRDIARRNILIGYGNSIIAGAGATSGNDWLSLIAGNWATSHPAWSVVNLGHSGYTDIDLDDAALRATVTGALARYRQAVVFYFETINSLAGGGSSGMETALSAAAAWASQQATVADLKTDIAALAGAGVGGVCPVKWQSMTVYENGIDTGAGKDAARRSVNASLLASVGSVYDAVDDLASVAPWDSNAHLGAAGYLYAGDGANTHLSDAGQAALAARQRPLLESTFGSF